MRSGGIPIKRNSEVDPRRVALEQYREINSGKPALVEPAKRKGIAVNDGQRYRELTGAGAGIDGSRFGDRASNFSKIGKMASAVSGPGTSVTANLLKLATQKWKFDDVVKLFEILIERGEPIISHPKFRELLTRDENLEVNQAIRTANGNIAYRSVDFDVAGLEDEAFWARIDETPYSDLVQNNAAVALLKMAEKFGILS